MRVVERDVAVLRWNGDGTYTPVCGICGYEGKAQAVHAAGRQIVRQHSRSRRHHENVARAKEQGWRLGGGKPQS